MKTKIKKVNIKHIDRYFIEDAILVFLIALVAVGIALVMYRDNQNDKLQDVPSGEFKKSIHDEAGAGARNE